MSDKKKTGPKHNPFIFDSKFASIYSDDRSEFSYELPIISKSRKTSKIICTEDIYIKILKNIVSCQKQLSQLKIEVNIKIAESKQLSMFEIL